MKKIFLAVVLMQLGALSTHAIASECSSIKSDKVRLKCYDMKETSRAANQKEIVLAKAEPGEMHEQEFKQLAIDFIRTAQANLALSALAWRNVLESPLSARTADALQKNRELQGSVSEGFSKLSSHPGYKGQLSEKINGYYDAWKLAYSQVRPTSSDSARGFSGRVDRELVKQDAIAAKLNLELQ